MRWGLSPEIGSKLPFSHAYFLSNHKLFTTFSQPLSCDGLLKLVHKIKESGNPTNTSSIVDHKSTWAIAINFPDWFYFAAFLLSGNSFGNLHQTSSWYISWILNPLTEESLSGMLVKNLSKKSVINLSTIKLWLEKFQDGKTKKNVMFRRIILGVLIGCYSSINEDGFELLLHYVATGSTESQHGGLKQVVECVCVVFKLTDLAERMSDSIYESRELAVDFICEIKLRVFKYLIKCVDKLVRFQVDKSNGFLFKDLHRRMLVWRHLGKDVFNGYKDLDNTIRMIASFF